MDKNVKWEINVVSLAISQILMTLDNINDNTMCFDRLTFEKLSGNI